MIEVLTLTDEPEDEEDGGAMDTDAARGLSEPVNILRVTPDDICFYVSRATHSRYACSKIETFLLAQS